MAFYNVDMAFNTASKMASDALGGWRNAADSGSMVDAFGSKAAVLKNKVLTFYDDATLEADEAGSARRSAKRADLVEFVSSEVAAIHSILLDTLSQQCVKKVQTVQWVTIAAHRY